jgi:hypothetical protein
MVNNNTVRHTEYTIRCPSKNKSVGIRIVINNGANVPYGIWISSLELRLQSQALAIELTPNGINRTSIIWQKRKKNAEIIL